MSSLPDTSTPNENGPPMNVAEGMSVLPPHKTMVEICKALGVAEYQRFDCSDNLKPAQKLRDYVGKYFGPDTGTQMVNHLLEPDERDEQVVDSLTNLSEKKKDAYRSQSLRIVDRAIEDLLRLKDRFGDWNSMEDEMIEELREIRNDMWQDDRGWQQERQT